MAASEINGTNGATPSTPASGTTSMFPNSSKVWGQVDDAGRAITFIGGGVGATTNPSDPTGTTDTTGKMAGLAVAATPARSGVLLVVVSGNLTNSGATAGQGAKAQIRYGTGSAPANAAALTGTTVGTMVTGTLARNVADLIPFCLTAVITGLSLGTAYWLDLQEVALTSGTGQIKNIAYSVVELP